MLPRLARVVLCLVVVASPVMVAAPVAAARVDVTVGAPDRFSPNGDGRQDSLRVRLTVPRTAHVRLTIGSPGGRVVNRRVDLGRLPRGTHTWTWDGRNQSGKVVDDEDYVIRVYDGRVRTYTTPVATEEVQVDTSFAPELTAPTFGAGRNATPRVYPRTTVVTDAIDLSAVSYETHVSSLELVIRNRRGRVVRRADVDEPVPYADGTGVRATGRTVSWAAVRGGGPLPKGRYTAVVVGADGAGNRGSSKPLRIWVSQDQLEWRETTTTLTAQGSHVAQCTYSSANGCGDPLPCGLVLPSAVYAEGLSHRPRACEPADPRRSDAAVSQHLLEVPEATGVRGVAAVRVSFVGTPTTAGETDAGTLTVPGDDGGATVVGTSGQSAWVEDPAWGEGLDRQYPVAQRDPAATWFFGTSDGNQVDVATYTVDVRYLAVAG